MTRPSAARYWFPAKTYGWGWGLPITWQGWVVMFAFIAAVAFVIAVFPPHRHLPAFLVGLFGCVIGLVAICWWKGEPARWRWGKKDG